MSKNNKRRSRGTLIIILLALALLLGLGLGWAKCGLGRGDADSEGGKDSPAAELPPAAAPPPVATLTTDAPAPRCALRISSDGTINANGATAATLTVAEAVAHCRASRDVTLQVAGDAPFGAVDDLRKALESSGLTVREP